MPYDRQTALPTGFGFGPPRRLGERPNPLPHPVARPRAEPQGGTSLQPIGVVARDFGVSLRTLRFYEDKGLLNPLRQGTARLYSADDRRRLTRILNGKALGFTLREICAMVAQSEAEPERREIIPSREQVRGQIAHLEQQKTEIEAALARLRRYEA